MYDEEFLLGRSVVIGRIFESGTGFDKEYGSARAELIKKIVLKKKKIFCKICKMYFVFLINEVTKF